LNENGKQSRCNSEFTDRKAVIFDEIKRCVKPIKGNPKESTNLIVPNEIQCTEKDNTFTRNKYWIRGKCEEKSIINIHDIIQI